MNSRKTLSIIIPVYNEQENIIAVYTQVLTILQSLQARYEYEFIFVNDGSKDASWPMLVHIAQNDARVKALNFSRNFGHQAALTAGYAHAIGDGVITMDADLQDTPTLLIDMVNAWEKGAQIVYARRIDRKDTFLKKIMAQCYYIFLDTVSDVRIPRNVGDFRLLDRKVVHFINHMPERSRYLRGMVAWTGFSHAFIDFKRPDRAAGISGYTWKKMFKLGFDGFTGFSTMPLKIALFTGLVMMLVATIVFGYMLFNGKSYDLVAWCMPIVMLFMGAQSISVWVLGEYVARVYEQQKGRPLYIVDQIIGHKNELEAALSPVYRSPEYAQKEYR